MLGYIQSNIKGVYNCKIFGEKKGSLIFVHMQFMGISLSISVIKMTITWINGNKMHLIIVLNISKLQETLPKLSHLIIKDRVTVCANLPKMVPIKEINEFCNLKIQRDSEAISHSMSFFTLLKGTGRVYGRNYPREMSSWQPSDGDAYFLPEPSKFRHKRGIWPAAAAAAKSLQSCPTLCDPIDSSPPGSPLPGVLQARTLEWVAISFSSVWQWKVEVKSLSRVRLLATPWTAAHQAPLPMGFSRQEDWSGVPLPSLVSSLVVHKFCSLGFLEDFWEVP